MNDLKSQHSSLKSTSDLQLQAIEKELLAKLSEISDVESNLLKESKDKQDIVNDLKNVTNERDDLKLKNTALTLRSEDLQNQVETE